MSSSGGAALLASVPALIDDLGVDDFLVGGRAALGRRAARARAGVRGLRLGVDRLAHLLADLGSVLAGRADGVGVRALQRLLQLIDGGLHLGPDVLGDLVGVLAEELLGLVGQALALVTDLRFLAALA